LLNRLLRLDSEFIQIHAFVFLGLTVPETRQRICQVNNSDKMTVKNRLT